MARKKRNFGSIRRLRSGNYQARYTGPDGVEVLGPHTFGSYKDADTWLAGEQTRLSHRAWSDPRGGKVTLGEFAEQWLRSKLDLKPKTRALYADQLTRFVTKPKCLAGENTVYPEIRDFRLIDLTPDLIDRWLQWVLDISASASRARDTPSTEGPAANRAIRAWAATQGRTVARTGRLPGGLREDWVAAGCPGLSPINRANDPGVVQAEKVLRLLRTILTSAVDRGLIFTNPCKGRKLPRTRDSSTPVASLQQLADIATAMPGRYQALIWVCTFASLRAGEASALARKHVDPAQGTITIERAVSYVPGEGRLIGPPKSRAGRRTIHLPAHVMTLLVDHMESWTPAGPEALVFGSERGTPLHASNRTAMFRRAAAVAGRPDLRFHDLRRTGATLAAAHGATLKELMQRLGHTTPRASLIYLEASDRADRDLAERLSSVPIPAARHEDATLAG